MVPAQLEAATRVDFEDAGRLCHALGFVPDEVQEKVLRSTAKRGILNCCRQWGKTQIIALKAVHRALTMPRSLTVVAAPSEAQSGEFVQVAREMIRELQIRTHGDGIRSTSLVLPNGSRMVGLPAQEYSTRGLRKVSLMIFDEAAQVPDGMYKTLRPMLATAQGDVWMMSTPYGRRGFFYETWAYGGNDWDRYTVTAPDCPRIPKEFLEEERRVHGVVWFRQEYLCEFVDAGGAVFDRDLVERALKKEVKPLWPGR